MNYRDALAPALLCLILSKVTEGSFETVAWAVASLIWFVAVVLGLFARPEEV